MTYSSVLTDYLGCGVAASRPVSLSISATAIGLYFATDTGLLSLWDGGWITVPTVAGNNTWSKAQRGAVVALTDASSIAADFNAGNNFSVTLGGNRTLANPSNITAGQAGQITVTQDGTGSRTLAYGSNWKFPGGTAPVLTTTAGAIDVLSYFCTDATRIAVSASLNFS
jgi:hypothetical protein